MGARIPVTSQLNIHCWKHHLKDYWDSQLLDFLEFGFPLGFNRNCLLKNEMCNHKSAIDSPEDVQVYINDEKEHCAIVGLFDVHPIANAHFSLFMTRYKPDASNRHVIIYLSWPHGFSVNDGVKRTVTYTKLMSKERFVI